MKFERNALIVLLLGAVFSAVCQWRLERKLNQLLTTQAGNY